MQRSVENEVTLFDWIGSSNEFLLDFWLCHVSRYQVYWNVFDTARACHVTFSWATFWYATARREQDNNYRYLYRKFRWGEKPFPGTWAKRRKFVWSTLYLSHRLKPSHQHQLFKWLEAWRWKANSRKHSYRQCFRQSGAYSSTREWLHSTLIGIR